MGNKECQRQQLGCAVQHERSNERVALGGFLVGRGVFPSVVVSPRLNELRHCKGQWREGAGVT